MTGAVRSHPTGGCCILCLPFTSRFRRCLLSATMGIDKERSLFLQYQGMRKRYQLVLFTVLAVMYCVVGVVAQNGVSPAKTIECSFPVSPGTRLFMADLEKELKDSKVGLKQFVPSAKLVERHSLQNLKGQYFVTGFIKVNGKFKPEQIKKIGGYSGKPSGKVRTVRIPLAAFSGFLKQKNIFYFEISQKQQLYRSHTN